MQLQHKQEQKISLQKIRICLELVNQREFIYLLVLCRVYLVVFCPDLSLSTWWKIKVASSLIRCIKIKIKILIC